MPDCRRCVWLSVFVVTISLPAIVRGQAPRSPAEDYPVSAAGQTPTYDGEYADERSSEHISRRPVGVPIRLAHRPPHVASSESPPLHDGPDAIHPSKQDLTSKSDEAATSVVSPATGIKAAREPIPLMALEDGAGGAGKTGSSSRGHAIWTVCGSLAVVMGAFFLLLWFTRRAFPKATQGLPGEVVEVLGQSPLWGRQSVQLLRVGERILVLAVSPAGIQTLTEISDDEEVQRLAASCRRSHPESVTTAFRQVLRQLSHDDRRGGNVRESSSGSSQSSHGHRHPVEV